MTKTLSYIVVSLEIANKLKNIGFPQKDSLIYHAKYPKGASGVKFEREFWENSGYRNDWKKVCAAPTAEEILEYIPDKFMTNKNTTGKTLIHYIERRGNSFSSGYLDYGENEHGNIIENKLVDALGLILIWLVDEGYVTFNKETTN
jgi:hypothetical protein